MKKAVVLLSGGLDSTTALYLAKSQGFELYSLCFNYGQRHDKEFIYAESVARKAGVKKHVLIQTNINDFGGSALTDPSIDIPQGEAHKEEIPVTYVPARNMIFLAYAASYAEAIGAQDIFIGVSQVDYSGYVDCRQTFIEAMENAINQGTVCAVEEGKKIKIHAPFMHMTKAEEIQIGLELGVDYRDTWTCYKGEEIACGECDSCILRRKAFAEIGVEDPIAYQV